MKNNLEEAWKEEFENLFNEKYNKILCGYTLKQWTTQERIDQERELALPYYIEGRNRSREEINNLESIKNKIILSLNDRSNQLEQELQKTREHLEKCGILVDEIILDIEICDRYFQSSSTRNQFQRKQLNRKKHYLKDKQGER